MCLIAASAHAAATLDHRGAACPSSGQSHSLRGAVRPTHRQDAGRQVFGVAGSPWPRCGRTRSSGCAHARQANRPRFHGSARLYRRLTEARHCRLTRHKQTLDRKDQIDGDNALGAGIEALHGSLALVQNRDVNGRCLESGIAQGSLYEAPNSPATVSEHHGHVPAGFEYAESLGKRATQEPFVALNGSISCACPWCGRRLRPRCPWCDLAKPHGTGSYRCKIYCCRRVGL